jgi:hypothetical protein
MICATTCTLPKGENVFLGSRFFVQCCVFDKREQETDMGNSCWTDILSRRGICVDDFSLSTPAYGIAGFGDSVTRCCFRCLGRLQARDTSTWVNKLDALAADFSCQKTGSLFHQRLVRIVITFLRLRFHPGEPRLTFYNLMPLLMLPSSH